MMVLLSCVLYHLTFRYTRASEAFRRVWKKLVGRFPTLTGGHIDLQSDPGKQGQVRRVEGLKESLGLSYACRLF